MSAFFIATVRIKDPQKFQEYANLAAETFSAHGGEVILRGKAETALAGETKHDAVGIVKFPDMEALSAWFHSNEYQAIIPLREKGAEMTIITYNTPA